MKLDWQEHPSSIHGEPPEQITYVGTDYRIRAIVDTSPSNPFEDDMNSGQWPMLVVTADTRRGKPDEYLGGGVIGDPIGAMSDIQLVHDQYAIATALGFGTVGSCLAIIDTDELDTKRTTDADKLRDAFDQALTDDGESANRSDHWETLATLWTIAGAVTLTATVTGHSQGDWADLFLLATPKDVKTFRAISHPWSDDDARIILGDLQQQADLYKAWAFGDVYGYIVERGELVAPDDFEDDPDYREMAWAEIDDGSCWGYYGADHDESGLAGAALDTILANMLDPKP